MCVRVCCRMRTLNLDLSTIRDMRKHSILHPALALENPLEIFTMQPSFSNWHFIIWYACWREIPRALNYIFLHRQSVNKFVWNGSFVVPSELVWRHRIFSHEYLIFVESSLVCLHSFSPWPEQNTAERRRKKTRITCEQENVSTATKK